MGSIIYKGYEITENVDPFFFKWQRYVICCPDYDGAPDGNNDLWHASNIEEAFGLIDNLDEWEIL